MNCQWESRCFVFIPITWKEPKEYLHQTKSQNYSGGDLNSMFVICYFVLGS